LSKWIEKGNKNCPLCRKDINVVMNNNAGSGGLQAPNNNITRNSIWSFSLRFGNNWSWLFPNITMRVIRSNETTLHNIRR